MTRQQGGFMLRSVAWILGLSILAVAAVFGINATDEELSEAARKAMVLPPVPKASPRNGYTDFLAIRSEMIDDRFRLPCKPMDRCLQHAADNPELVALSVRPDEFLERYRAMRAKPEFVDLEDPQTPDDPLPPYQALFRGQTRSLMIAGSGAMRRDLHGAVSELEAENRFHRRIAAGARSLITKMVALSVLNRDAAFASELARIPEAPEPLLARLKTIVRPLTETELDVRKSLTVDRAYKIAWMQTRRFVRLPDHYYESLKALHGRDERRPLWEPVAPYLYRPRQTVNLLAAQSDILLAVGDLPPTEYVSAAQSAVARATALAPETIAAALVNPVGNGHPYASVIPGMSGNADDITPYFGRAHVTQGLYSAVSLQIALRQAGIMSAVAVGEALDGPIFKAYLDPFTGKPMRFDEKTRTVGFESPVGSGGVVDAMRERYGRVAVELAIADAGR
jgi:hypothetical protein